MYRSRYIAWIALTLAAIGATGCGKETVEAPLDLACPAAKEGDANEIPAERAELLLGYSEEDAQRCAETLGWGFRVAKRDNEVFALTADYRSNRVNVTVKKNLVTAIYVG